MWGNTSSGGINYRTPMAYNVYDHDTGREAVPKQPLRNTNESVHSSVRLRSGLPGKGAFDKDDYNPKALEGWTCPRRPAVGRASEPRRPRRALNEGQSRIYWEFAGKQGAERKTMPEAPLGTLELELLGRILPSIEEKFLSVQPKSVPNHA